VILVYADLNEAGVISASLICFSEMGARRGPESGEDVDELPPALRLSAPSKMNDVVHVCIVLERHRVPARKSLL
jgi:hypothetical protein